MRHGGQTHSASQVSDVGPPKGNDAWLIGAYLRGDSGGLSPNDLELRRYRARRHCHQRRGGERRREG